MSATTFSSRDFARDAGAIKRATANGPVFITDRGRPALAVLKIEDYYRLTRDHNNESLLSAMQRIPGGSNIELKLPARRKSGSLESRIPDFDSTANKA